MSIYKSWIPDIFLRTSSVIKECFIFCNPNHYWLLIVKNLRIRKNMVQSFISNKYYVFILESVSAALPTMKMHRVHKYAKFHHSKRRKSFSHRSRKNAASLRSNAKRRKIVFEKGKKTRAVWRPCRSSPTLQNLCLFSVIFIIVSFGQH